MNVVTYNLSGCVVHSHAGGVPFGSSNVAAPFFGHLPHLDAL
jgi:hypothetical protein